MENEEMEHKFKIKKRVGNKGGLLGITFTEPMLDYLGIKNGSEVIITIEKGKHGPFLAIFNEEQNKKLKEVDNSELM